MSTIQPPVLGVKRQTLPTQVATVLVQRLAGGSNDAEAALLSEPAVCREFAVSRGVAREALRILASLDMITIAQGRPVVLRPATDWDYLDPRLFEWLPAEEANGLLRELHEARLILEPELAARAAAAIGEDALDRIHGSLDRMSTLEGDPDRYLEADLAFHIEICRAARNRLLDRIMRSSRWLLIASRKVTNRLPPGLSAATRSHSRIFAALAARDPEAARQAMRRHLEAGSRAWLGQPR